MNYAEIKEFVRTHAETDDTDAPDTTLDVYARSAYNDIRRRLGNWDENHISDTLTVTAGTVSYELTGGGFTNSNLEYVTGIVGDTDVLEYVPWDAYLQMRDGADVTYQTREADYYTIKDNTVFLYPDPSTNAVTYTVYGFSTWADWPTGSAESPLPREFDEPICWYMLAKYYQSQEDLELAQVMMADYERSVNRMLAFTQRKTANRPKIFGGTRYRRSRFMSYGDWMRRNTQG